MHRHVREMHIHVVEFLHAGVIFDGAEATESQLEEIRLERPEGRDESVQTQIELLTADQQRIVDVPVGRNRRGGTAWDRIVGQSFFLPITPKSRRDCTPGYNVRIFRQVRIEGGLRFARPLFQFAELIDEEYSGALRLSARLHYPRALRWLAILLHEHVVIWMSCVISEKRYLRWLRKLEN